MDDTNNKANKGNFDKSTGFLRSNGSCRNMYFYRKSVVIYDLTFYFANKYLNKKDRTVDQMIQAARSGKQNIIEGSMASGTSKETEIKLTNVARASLEELFLELTEDGGEEA